VIRLHLFAPLSHRSFACNSEHIRWQMQWANVGCRNSCLAGNEMAVLQIMVTALFQPLDSQETIWQSQTALETPTCLKKQANFCSYHSSARSIGIEFSW
jgi:hypothetical protein